MILHFDNRDIRDPQSLKIITENAFCTVFQHPDGITGRWREGKMLERKILLAHRVENMLRFRQCKGNYFIFLWSRTEMKYKIIRLIVLPKLQYLNHNLYIMTFMTFHLQIFASKSNHCIDLDGNKDVMHKKCDRLPFIDPTYIDTSSSTKIISNHFRLGHARFTHPFGMENRTCRQ